MDKIFQLILERMRCRFHPYLPPNARWRYYPMRLVAWGTGLTVLVEAPKRVFEVLKLLQELKKPIRRDDEFYRLLENPTLENVERFVAVRRLMEE